MEKFIKRQTVERVMGQAEGAGDEAAEEAVGAFKELLHSPGLEGLDVTGPR